MKKKTGFNWILTAGILTLAVLLSFALDAFGIRAENIILVYIAAILVIIIETKNIAFGLGSTLILVFVFNFFFITPRYSFAIDDPNYIITLLIFFSVAFVANIMTSRLQKEVEMSKENERKMSTLYLISKKLSTLNSEKEILAAEIEALETFLGEPVLIVLRKEGEEEEFFGATARFELGMWQKEIAFSIDYGQICGKGENKFSEMPFKTFPFLSKDSLKGALLIGVSHNRKFSHMEKEFIATNAVNMLVALDRIKVTREKENTKVDMEKERFRNALLRSLSHDLRTPLTTIQSGTEFLLDSSASIDEGTRKELLRDVNNEAGLMAQFVDNLLNMTKVNSNQLVLHRKKELVDDLLSTVYSRVYKRLESHALEVITKDETVSCYVDAPLMIQVFVNLVDNAIKHTREGAFIKLDYQKKEDGIVFFVYDNGGGIQDKDPQNLFSDFVTLSEAKQDKTRGMGLGLSISKAIVEAHGGWIKAYNNEFQGATFEFFLPDQTKGK